MSSREGRTGCGGDCYYSAVKRRVFPLQLYKRFKVEAPAEYLGRGKEWNIDLIPKFFLASGESMRNYHRTFVEHFVARILVQMSRLSVCLTVHF